MTGDCRLVRVKFACGCVIYVTPDMAQSPPPHFRADCPKNTNKERGNDRDR